MKHVTTLSISIIIYLAGFSQAGTLDKSFNGSGKKVIGFKFGGYNGDDACFAMAIQSDGKSVLAGKSSATSGGDYNFIVVRLNTDGSLDQSFNNKGYILINFSGDDEAAAVAIQSDGKIVVAGTANASGRRRKIALLRLLTNGVPDPSFGPNFSGKVITDVGNDAATYCMALQNGKIIIGGDIIDNNSKCLLLRYNGDGSPDQSFGVLGKSITNLGTGEFPHGVAIQSDGKIVAGCSEGGSYAYSHFIVARFTSNGILDGNFGTNGKTNTDFGLNDFCTSIAVQSNDKIVATGFTYNSHFNFAIARYTKDGTPDNTFSGDGKTVTDIDNVAHSDDFAYDVAIQGDNKIVVAGSTHVNDYNFALVRYNTNGTLDNTFSGDGKTVTDFGDNEEVYAVKIQANSKIVAAGAKNILTGDRNFAIARYHGDNAAPENIASETKDKNKIATEKFSSIHIYPNPVTTTLHVEGLNASSPAIISITDLRGIVFQKATVNDSEYTFDVSALKPGIYSVTISFSTGELKTMRFVKQ